MRIDKLAMTSREALQNAIGIASDAQAGAVEPIHLLAALLTGGERNISVIIERIGADPALLASSTQAAIERAPKVEGSQQQLSGDLTRVLERAEKKARLLGLGDRAPGGGDPRLTPSDNKPPAGRARASTHRRRAFTSPFWAAQGPRP